MAGALPALAITTYWAPLNEQLIGLIDLIPDEQMNWSPKPELHNFRGILIHVSMSRHGWLTYTVKDGETSPDVLREGQTKEGLKEQLRLSWARMERFLSDQAKLSAVYEDDFRDATPEDIAALSTTPPAASGSPVRERPGGNVSVTGNWIAFQQLEHDVHHRADIFHYLALLGIEHGEIQAP